MIFVLGLMGNLDRASGDKQGGKHDQRFHVGLLRERINLLVLPVSFLAGNNADRFSPQAKEFWWSDVRITA